MASPSPSLYPQSRNRGIFSVLQAGIFEVIFICFLLFVLFGTLNYFNLLSLSRSYPRVLGWLPHQQSEQTDTATHITLPLPYTSSVYFTVLYTYVGTIADMKQQNTGYELIFTPENPTVQPFKFKTAPFTQYGTAKLRNGRYAFSPDPSLTPKNFSNGSRVLIQLGYQPALKQFDLQVLGKL